jgi:hypothetical protein
VGTRRLTFYRRKVQDLRPRQARKEMHQGDSSVYAENVDLNFYGKSITIRNMRGKTIETDGPKLPLDALKLVGIGRRDRISNYRDIFEPD